ncbi:uncharacterized protein LOC135466898 [Liolophura sinensis]|uniref:uncharacterized protein LOC135466898 n=1 Tax=Liolophura sinensis TaxID=3198878 RepID=UPI003158107E
MAGWQGNESRPTTLKHLALEVLRADAEINATKSSIQRLASDVQELSLKNEEDRVNRLWCCHGNPRSEAWRMAEKLRYNPDLLSDVISSLNEKLKQCRMETSQLRQKCNPG